MSWWFYILLIIFPLAGGIVAYFANLSNKLNIKVVLAFAGAYLLSVVLFHLIPHIYAEANVLSGILLLAGFFSHEMPAAFAMVSILKASHVTPKLLKWFIVIYASMSAMGAGISSLLKNSVDPNMFEYLMAFVVGTFLHIATTILFENSEEHRFSRNKVLAIIGGVCLAALVSL